MEDYSKLKYSELKELCKDRNLNSTGKKVVLIKRLEEDDDKYKLKDGEIEVYAKTIMCMCYTFKIMKDRTILDLKHMIADKLNRAVDDIRLNIYGLDDDGNTILVPVDDNKTFIDQNIYNGSSFELSFRLFSRRKK